MLGDGGAQGLQGGPSGVVVETLAHRAGETADEVEDVVLILSRN